MASSDWELVQRAQQGDREAFRTLVERYQRKIAALALGMLRNREDALDIVQETFTKAYQSLDRFKGDSAFYTWVYRIAYNLCVDQQRRTTKQPQLSLDDDSGTTGAVPVVDGPRPDQPFERARDAEIARRVQTAIRELTPDHRAVILLRELEGLSYEEISHVLDCPKGTVMSRLHYARRQLQARLRGLL
ncbi:MAG TPA: sigma-70 family RNA polymerase sigma factor [Gaiellaceae bacterium]|nr:sigma-70 family RNA polymerase sigma factor [Gaiellaceae bacterium]